MKQFRIYLALLCAMLLTVGCSKDMETETTRPTDAASLIEIGDFPAFDQGTDTRATGTPDPGKTEWADGDKVLLKISFSNPEIHNYYTFTYNGTTTKWTTDKSLNLPDYRATSADIIAYYAPAYEWGAAHTGTPTLKSDKVAGADEYLTYTATGVVLSNGISIDFSGTRPYSRLRVATLVGAAVQFTPSNATFTPAGSAAALSDGTSLSVEADANGNAFFYGTWTASEFNFTMTKGSGSFQLKKTVAVSVNGESYAVDARIANVDAATHTLELKAAGFLTADHIATALGGGTVLTVSGTLNADDVTTLTAATSLTGIDLRGVTYPAATRTVGTVPSADWSGCTNLSAILINTADAAAYKAAWSTASDKLLYLGKERVHKVDAMTDEYNKNGVPCVVMGITGFESHRLISRNPYCSFNVEGTEIGILGTSGISSGCVYSKLAAIIKPWGGKVATLDDLKALVPLRPNSFTEVTKAENGNRYISIPDNYFFIADSGGSQYVKTYTYNKDTKEFTLGYQYTPVDIYSGGQLTFITFDVTNAGAIPDAWKQ